MRGRAGIATLAASYRESGNASERRRFVFGYLRSRAFCIGIFAFAALALQPFAAEAAAPEGALKAFLAGFAEMAAQGDADAMAKVTRFPLKNRVFQQPAQIGAAGFKRQFASNGFGEMGKCLKTQPPRRSAGANASLGQWAVDFDGNVFYFSQESVGWRFTGFENVNE